jgi:tRNA (adenine22-N1)-methyltransferase
VGVSLKKIKLSERLKTVADFVDEGARVADVGTDHGFIPVFLIQEGITNKVIASDINEGPLDSAVRTAEEYSVSDIDFRLCDGLNGIKQDEADTVIIAGMGGETIISIINTSGWNWERKSLILQPMSKQAELIIWLYENGFTVIKEAFATEGKETYRLLKAVYKRSQLPRLAYIYGGFTYSPYTEKQIRKFRRALKGLEKAAEPEDKKEEYINILEDIKAAYVHN